MFDMARAAPLKIGIADQDAAKTHSGLISIFSLHLIKTEILPDALGRLLNHAQQVRLIADYSDDSVKPNKAVEVVEGAADFIAAIDKALF
jgi:uncharacterized protein (UPF0332 family)